jgi:EAL domain-containing protein (putative c-di-GMP-specific phosphodiesterase class I)
LARPPETTAFTVPAGPVPAAATVLPFGKRPLRTFALVVALPVFLLYVMSVVLVIAALAIMAGEMDRLEVQRSLTSMHAALGSVLNDLSSAVADEGTWDEAYLNVVIKPDPAWLDATWGAAARLGQSYDSVFVTDQAGDIVFGQTATGSITGNIATRIPAAHTMLANLDKGIAATGDATPVSGFAADPDGSIGLAAISIHNAAPGQLAVPRGTRRILWIGRHLTPGLLQDIAVRYQSPLAGLDATPDAGMSTMIIKDADGKPVGTLAWTPDRPGQTAFDRALMVATGVFFVIGVVLALCLAAIRRAFVRRAEQVATVQTATLEAAASSTLVAAGVPAAAPEPAPAEIELGSAGGVNAVDFIIEYQPILDLRSEALLGAEALLRWKRPDGTFLTQESLSPRERARLLDRAGIIALRRVAAEIAPLLGVAVTLTVTPEQLQSGVYSEKVIGTLGATHLPAARLELAVDTPLLPPVAEIAASIGELRQFGVAVALADFSIDPTTAAYLDANLVNRVRLATSLTAKDDGGAAHEALLAATVEAARTTGLAVTVPGIERREQAAKLLRLGCREFQGELLARPLPLAAFTQLVLAPPRPAARKAG